VLAAARQDQRAVGSETVHLAVDVQFALTGLAQHDLVAVVAVRRRGRAGRDRLAPQRDLAQALGLAGPGGMGDARNRRGHGAGLFDHMHGELH